MARRFAVSKFEVTAEQWQTCVAYGGCTPGGGKGRQPVSSVSWHDARHYAAWLSKMTGKSYRLLSEAEWENAARAGTTTAYFWGDDIGQGNANCTGCGSEWDRKQAAPVGSFKPNAFGLHDMHGTVWEWVADTWHPNYRGAPEDGSVWKGGDESRRVVRGGSWNNTPQNLRSAGRVWYRPGGRDDLLGFRLASTLLRPSRCDHGRSGCATGRHRTNISTRPIKRSGPFMMTGLGECPGHGGAGPGSSRLTGAAGARFDRRPLAKVRWTPARATR